MKLIHIPSLFTIALAALLFNPFLANDSLAASAHEELSSEKNGQSRVRAFSIHDNDQDGYLSREEYRHFIEKIENHRLATGQPMRRFSSPLSFEEIDSSGDGYITEDEMIIALNKLLRKHRRYQYRGNLW